jgi:hypothetical protein
MSELKQIEIDLDVNRAIEADRRSFRETPNDILRRRYGIDSAKPSEVAGTSSRNTKVKLARRGGDYTVEVRGEQIAGGSLKSILKSVLLTMENQEPGYLEKLAKHRTSRGRRIVAKKPEELYPGKPRLVENCAEQLNGRWWYDTNVSFNQAQRYLDVVAEQANLDGRLVLRK